MEASLFHHDRILIVEDNVYLALDLSNAIEDCNGHVVGPVRTVAEALSLIESQQLSGAVLDFHLEDRDSSPIAESLADQRVPFVIHSCVDLPFEITSLYSNVPILMKPLHPSFVLECLLSEIRKNAPRDRPISLPS
jgi:DNA-binding response OmpR family regulator